MNIGESAEDSCRRLVRLLPADYRAAHGEDLVVTLQDTVDERGVLPLRERLAVLALALRLRLVTPVSGPAAAALVIMLFVVQTGTALASLLLGTVGAALFLRQPWAPPADAGLPLSFNLGEELAYQVAEDAVFAAAWLLVLHGVLHRRRFAAPVAALLTGGPLLLQAINNPHGLLWPGRLLLAATVVAALVVWRRGPVPVPGSPRRWWFALPAVVVLPLAQAEFLYLLPEQLRAPLVWTVAAAVLAVAVVVTRNRPWLALAGSWLAALLALAYAVPLGPVSGYPAIPHVPAAAVVALVLLCLAVFSPAGGVRRVARR